MADVNLDFLARQIERVMAEIGSLRDDISVLTALTLRVDGTMSGVQQELLATHGQISRMNDRARMPKDSTTR